MKTLALALVFAACSKRDAAEREAPPVKVPQVVFPDTVTEDAGAHYTFSASDDAGPHEVAPAPSASASWQPWQPSSPPMNHNPWINGK